MEYLNMTRDAFYAHINSSRANTIDKVTVGAAIIRDNKNTKEILLLKSNADEDYYPNVFEIPGGKVDETDTSIHHAIVREVAEETNWTVKSVLSPLSTMTYGTEKKVLDDIGNETIIQRRAMQLSYIVFVHEDGIDFSVNKDEHSTGIWANAQMLNTLSITPDMKRIVLEALALH